MAYIYRKTAGDKQYYYLRASERKGSRTITKDIAYLGSSISEAEKALSRLQGHKEQIRKAYKTIHKFLESNHYLEQAELMKLKKNEFIEKLSEIEACRMHYSSVFLNNDEATKKEVLKNFVIELAFNTASIEGNTITLQQARNLLEEGLTPKNKTLREIYDLQNSERAFFSLFELNENISHELIIKMHSELMKNIDARAGYRTADVRVVKANFNSTPAPYVKTDMDILIKWHDENKKKMHPLALSAIFHHKFEKIHPFMDGNGRTGRMLMKYILIKSGYPPLIIHRKFRQEYLNCLRKADKSELTKTLKKDYLPLISFIADEMNEHYWNMFL